MFKLLTLVGILVITFSSLAFGHGHAVEQKNAEGKYEDLVNQVLGNFKDFSNDLLKIRMGQWNTTVELNRLGNRQADERTQLSSFKSELHGVKKMLADLSIVVLSSCSTSSSSSGSMAGAGSATLASRPSPQVYGACNTTAFRPWREVIDRFDALNPVVGGADYSNATLYICRVNHRGLSFIGKASLDPSQKTGSCNVADPEDGREHFLFHSDFEIFTNPMDANLKWIAVDEADTNPIPSNAVIGGKQADETMYVGRCDLTYGGLRSLVPGTLLAGSTEALLVPFGFIAHKCSPYAILVCDGDELRLPHYTI